MDRKHQLKGIALVMFSVFIWSGWMVISRYGIKGTLSAYDITFIRFITSGLILLPVAFKKGLRIGPWGLKGGFLLSLLIGAAYTNIVIFGMQFAPVSHTSTIINGTLLIITTIVGVHGLREHISRVRIFGVICSLCGIAIMLFSNKNQLPDQWIGHLLFIAGGILWSTYTLLIKAWKANSLHAATVVCVFSMITYVPFYLLFCKSHIGFSNWQEVLLQLVYQGILTAVIALITFNMGVQILGAARAGAFIPLIPALSTMLAIPFLGEVPSAMEWTGIVTVSLGVFLASGFVDRFRHKTPA